MIYLVTLTDQTERPRQFIAVAGDPDRALTKVRRLLQADEVDEVLVTELSDFLSDVAELPSPAEY